MSKFYFVFAAVMAAGIISSAAVIPQASFTIQGVDVRNKTDKYVLSISKENILLNERSYTLKKLNGDIVDQGEAVFLGRDPKNDIESIWMNERVQLKIGRMVGEQAPKQVVVYKNIKTNKTFAFELQQH
jgi:hypothetical protein